MKSVLVLSGAILVMGLVGATEGFAQPRGSYLESCHRVRQDGPILRAICRDRYGDERPTRLDLRECRSPPANTNGRLTC